MPKMQNVNAREKQSREYIYNISEICERQRKSTIYFCTQDASISNATAKNLFVTERTTLSLLIEIANDVAGNL